MLTNISPGHLQMNTIPKILQREHVMCAAQTGKLGSFSIKMNSASLAE